MEAGLIAADDQGRARGEAFVKAVEAGWRNKHQPVVARFAASIQRNRSRATEDARVHDRRFADSRRDERHADRRQRSQGDVNPACRLFTFGVGYDVNTALLDKLAAENGGVADYVEPKEDLEVKVSNFFSKVNYPVLTDLQLDMGGAQTDLIYPRSIPDVFRGSQVTLIGRYSNESDLNSHAIEVERQSGRRNADLHLRQSELPVAQRCKRLSAALVGDSSRWLADGTGRTNGEQKELRDEIVGLGTRYGIVTPYTSYLALEGRAHVDQRARQTVTRRAATGGGFGNLVRSLPSAPKVAAKSVIVTGADAVQQSKMQREQQDVLRIKDTSQRLRRLD